MNWAERFGDATFGFLQERPYPVASPASVEAVQQIVQACADENWRVLPLGQGSSFPPNFALRSERVFAVITSRLRDVERLPNGRMLCGPGVPVQKLIVTEQLVERKTIGGLLCGVGDAVTRSAARSFWQLVHSVELLDSKGQVMALAGPASPQYLLGASAAMLLESRGKSGIVIGVEFAADELPFELGRKSLLSGQSEQLPYAVSRQVSNRQADTLSLFDW
ncbi:MAG: FAD-binding protein [bacterium]|nr:FAD-binding protein [bacterium]MBK8130300.1 FAD-binding protein [bacterium]